MSVLLHLSDTHFGTEQAPVVEALVALAQRLRPDLVLLSGDITQRARPSQFRAARALVDRLGAPWLVIPGNHDISLFNPFSRGLHPYARFSEAFGPVLEPCYESTDLLVIGVKTTRRWRHKHGEVSAEQIERVARQLRSAQEQQLRVVVVHQPIAVPDPGEASNLLRGSLLAQQAWPEAGVDLVLGGHIHLPFVMPLSGGARAAWAIQAGSAVSSRLRHGVPNSINVLRWEPKARNQLASEGAYEGRAGRCITVEQWDYSSTARAFEQTASHTLRPAADQLQH